MGASHSALFKRHIHREAVILQRLDHQPKSLGLSFLSALYLLLPSRCCRPNPSCLSPPPPASLPLFAPTHASYRAFSSAPLSSTVPTLSPPFSLLLSLAIRLSSRIPFHVHVFTSSYPLPSPSPPLPLLLIGLIHHKTDHCILLPAFCVSFPLLGNVQSRLTDLASPNPPPSLSSYAVRHSSLFDRVCLCFCRALSYYLWVLWVPLYRRSFI